MSTPVDPVETGTPLHFSAISAQLGFLKGELLTIAGATFTDKEQRKAFKDLIRERFSSRLNYISKLCGCDNGPCEASKLIG
jgi:hypothetical protein